MSTFASVFKSLRTSHGYTQEDLSKLLNITRSRLGMYETGKREPDFETMESIADFFNVDMDYLLGRTNKTTYIPESREGDSVKFPGYFKQYIFDEDIASYASRLNKRSILKDLLDKADALNDSEIRIIMSLADKFVEERNNKGGAKTP